MTTSHAATEPAEPDRIPMGIAGIDAVFHGLEAGELLPDLRELTGTLEGGE